MYHDPLAVESMRGSAYILRYFLNFLSCNMIPIVYDIRMGDKKDLNQPHFCKTTGRKNGEFSAGIREGELSQTPSAEYDVRFIKVSRISPDPMVQILKETNMESKGHKYNSFLRRFRLKVKPSSKVYGKKDRRQNRNAHKGDDL